MRDEEEQGGEGAARARRGVRPEGGSFVPGDGATAKKVMRYLLMSEFT